MATKYRVKLRCRACGHEYSRILKHLNDPDPPCPRKACRTAATPLLGIDLEGGKAPSIGGSNTARAIKETSEMVMQTYGLSDLRDDMRPGENAVPKLPPAMQSQVDNFWGGSRGTIKAKTIAAQAMAGAFSPGSTGAPDPVAMTHAAKYRPPVRLVNEK